MMIASKSRAESGSTLSAAACEPVMVPSSSVHAVKGKRAAGEHAALGRGRRALQPLAHHVGGAGEEAVGMRIIGRPHDLVGADIIGEHLERTFDRLKRNPAVPPEEVARPRLQAGIVKPLVVEM